MENSIYRTNRHMRLAGDILNCNHRIAIRLNLTSLTHLLRWWIAVADFIIYAGSVDNPYIDANGRTSLL